MRSRSDHGSALVEVVWLAILLMVPLVYVMLTVFEVQRSAFAVSAAARSAGRAYSMAPSEADGHDRADSAAVVALADQRLDVARRQVQFTCSPEPNNCLAPGSVITAAVSYPVPLPLLPAALGGQLPSIRVEAVHRVPYGSFREDRP